MVTGELRVPEHVGYVGTSVLLLIESILLRGTLTAIGVTTSVLGMGGTRRGRADVVGHVGEGGEKGGVRGRIVGRGV